MERIFIGVLLAAPFYAGAQSGTSATLATYIIAAITFINGYIIPFLVAISFFALLWGIAKYFIFSGASEDARETGRKLALWGVLAFVVMLSIWGIVYTMLTGFGINRNRPVCPDYNPRCYTAPSTPTPGSQIHNTISI